jgi:phi13 family phage major tail protein|nr:MAG TPA: major tail protein [Caudoviricetes sp.]
MAIKTRKPPMKETVGAQYICFAQDSEDGSFSGNYETDVEKTEVVKSVKVTENTETSDTYASGKVYDSDSETSSHEVEVEVVAFPDDTLAKMRGDSVDTAGLVLSGGNRIRPYFAYGKVVKLRKGGFRYDWYPKCRLTENSDDIATSEEKASDQTDTIKIKAYPFNNDGDIVARVGSGSAPEGLTEEKFFSKPILTKEDLAAVAGAE